MDQYRRLTDAQRKTLRLYHRHMQIKEIALELGISESTVNQRLTRCREILGAPSSGTAAIWLADYEEANAICSRPSYRFSAMVNTDVLPSVEVETLTGVDDDSATIEQAQDEEAAPSLLEPHAPPSLWLPIATARTPKNRLDRWSRLAMVGAMAAFLMAIALMLAILAIGLQEILVSLQHHILPPA